MSDHNSSLVVVILPTKFTIHCSQATTCNLKLKPTTLSRFFLGKPAVDQPVKKFRFSEETTNFLIMS